MPTGDKLAFQSRNLFLQHNRVEFRLNKNEVKSNAFRAVLNRHKIKRDKNSPILEGEKQMVRQFVERGKARRFYCGWLKRFLNDVTFSFPSHVLDDVVIQTRLPTRTSCEMN